MSQPRMPMVVDALVPRRALDDGMRSRARILVGARDAVDAGMRLISKRIELVVMGRRAK